MVSPRQANLCGAALSSFPDTDTAVVASVVAPRGHGAAWPGCDDGVMAIFEGGAGWWLPRKSDDHVQVTEGVMSYEVDGELRLAESIGTLDRADLTSNADGANGE